MGDWLKESFRVLFSYAFLCVWNFSVIKKLKEIQRSEFRLNDRNDLIWSVKLISDYSAGQMMRTVVQQLLKCFKMSEYFHLSGLPLGVSVQRCLVSRFNVSFCCCRVMLVSLALCRFQENRKTWSAS